MSAIRTTAYVKNLQNFQVKRFATSSKVTLLLSLLPMLIVVIMAFQESDTSFAVFAEFSEWQSFTTTELRAEQVVTEPTQVGSNFQLMLEGIWSSRKSEINGNSVWNIAGITRILAIVTASVGVFVVYRRGTAEWYAVHNFIAQHNDFESLTDGIFLFTRILYSIGTAFGTYIATSIFWVAVAQIFPNLVLNSWAAGIVIVLFTGVFTLAAVFWAYAATTKELLLLVFITFVAGMAVSLSIIDPNSVREAVSLGSQCVEVEWWCEALSVAGMAPPSAPLFTATLIATGLALWVLWYDIDSGFATAFRQVQTKFLSASLLLMMVRSGYLLLMLGLAVVGLFNLDSVFHKVGILMAVIGTLLLFLSLLGVFTTAYRLFLIGIMIIVVMSGLFWWRDVINTTAVELIAFLLVGIWLYVTVETLILTANMVNET